MSAEKPYSYTISNDGILRISTKTGGSLRAVYNLITEFSSDPGFSPGMDIIADARGGDYTPSVTDMLCLGKMVGDMRDSFSGSFAVIAEQKGLQFTAKLMCATARAKGFNIRAFASEEEAEEWIKSRGDEESIEDAEGDVAKAY